MKAKYSKEEFKGYIYRFAIKVSIDKPDSHTIQVYSKSENRNSLLKYLDENLTENEKPFEIECISDRYRDENSLRRNQSFEKLRSLIGEKNTSFFN